MSGIEPGDYVRIGDSPLTWFVVAIYPADQSANGPLASLTSGQTERHRYEPVANLTLHTRASIE